METYLTTPPIETDQTTPARSLRRISSLDIRCPGSGRFTLHARPNSSSRRR